LISPLAVRLRRPSRLGAPGFARGGPRLWIGAGLVGFFVLIALLAPLLAPHDPIEQDLFVDPITAGLDAGR